MNEIQKKEVEANKDNKIFKQVLNENKIKRPVLLNGLKAFVIGGCICLVGEIIRVVLMKVFELDTKSANTITLIIIILLASILTGFGIYDKIGQNGGAGCIIPITGFANSLTSSAIESKSEGLILGVMTNLFKLAGAIIVAGIASSFAVGTIVYLFRLLNV